MDGHHVLMLPILSLNRRQLSRLCLANLPVVVGPGEAVLNFGYRRRTICVTRCGEELYSNRQYLVRLRAQDERLRR